ncbi:conserved hypothetical protein [Methanospirillum hungatei JF-1]|nr:conserved hypothetical protein [Methanospirillum hungatei JF-1]
MPVSVHPHTHGELIISIDLYFSLFGSSPYTRGTPISSDIIVLRARFIPIHTGNSRPSEVHIRICPVHPHTHGELVLMAPLSVFYPGSSPYTRGTHDICHGSYYQCRFIPIHTGNSSSNHSLIKSYTGSSPYTRGTLSGFPHRIPGLRFIPIHTGNSYTFGEHLNTLSGSSPYTRGTLKSLF